MYKVKIYSLSEIVEVETFKEAIAIVEKEQETKKNLCIVEDDMGSKWKTEFNPWRNK